MLNTADAAVTAEDTNFGRRYTATIPLDARTSDLLGTPEAELIAEFDRETQTIRAVIYGTVAIHLPTVASLGGGAVQRGVDREFDGLLSDMRRSGEAWKQCLTAIINHHQENDQ